ncbi:hypothetical protein V2J09_020714 [Rumex salicifolius]
MESSSSGSGGLTITNAVGGMKIENPFTFKVFQIFTGFGVGCGVGIGAGSPLNLGAIPMLNQVMSAASGATYAFSGAGRHVNDALKKIGAKNIQAGLGCGVGFGHGFGVGLALKPGVVHQVQLFAVDAAEKAMTKFGLSQNISTTQGVLPSTSMQIGTSIASQASPHNPLGNTMHFGGASDNPLLGLPGDKNMSKGLSYETIQSQSVVGNSSFGNRSEKVISSFLQNPVMQEDNELKQTNERQLQQENRMLHMVLKHEQVIEELKKENEKLRRILVEELKVSADKIHSANSSKSASSACSDCFECRDFQNVCLEDQEASRVKANSVWCDHEVNQ